MQYNLRKLQVLYAIKFCSENNINATCRIITGLVDGRMTSVGACLTRYFDYRYVKRKRVPKVDGQVYSLSKKGKNALAKYMDRFVEGHHLNLKWKPEPVEFEITELLPGLNKKELDYEIIRNPLRCHKRNC